MCAFDKSIDTCNGDSGGPMTVSYKIHDNNTEGVKSPQNVRVLVGVVSYGPSDCADGRYDHTICLYAKL